MDFKNRDHVETDRLHLKDENDELMYDSGPDGNPDKTKPVAVVVYGPGTKQHAKAQTDQRNTMIRRSKKRGGSVEQTTQERIDDDAQFLATCTHSWENFTYGDLEGTEMSRAAYADIGLGFIAKQVSDHIGNWANFTKRSTPS